MSRKSLILMKSFKPETWRAPAAHILLDTAGGIISREIFAEGRMPLIEDHFLAQSLAIEAGYRYSDYNLGFKTNTYKFGVEYSPISDVRLRASFQRAVRAPNVTELFTPQAVVLDGTSDPCAGTPAQLATRGITVAQCVAAGVPAAAFGTVLPNTASQYQGKLGGNPALQPETALTSSFGIGWTPSYVPGLRVQVDYFDIKIENVITNIGGSAILNQCVNSGQFCNMIHRDANNSLWLSQAGFVDDPLLNIGQFETRGIDLDVSYGFDIGPAGKIRTNLVGTTWMSIRSRRWPAIQAPRSTAPASTALPAVLALRPAIQSSAGATPCAPPGRRRGRAWMSPHRGVTSPP